MVQMSNLLPIFTNASEGPRAQGLVSGWISLWPVSGSNPDPRPRQRVEVYVPSAVRQRQLDVFGGSFLKQHWKQRKKRRIIKPTSIWNMILGAFLNQTCNIMLFLRRLSFFVGFVF